MVIIPVCLTWTNVVIRTGIRIVTWTMTATSFDTFRYRVDNLFIWVQFPPIFHKYFHDGSYFARIAG